jgi:catechol 2,3-dioxygenase-like lactoylglutathione lyase family enzyme
VIALAIKHGGRQEGKTIQVAGKKQAAVRDPDGNTIELYSEE